MTVTIPAALEASRAKGTAWGTWLDALPGLADALVEEWQLSFDGEPTHGNCSLVVPVRTTSGRPAMLKIGWPHPEAEHEHLALKRWAGDGAVELLRADPHRFALLLERLHPEDLMDLWDLAACEIVAGFYGRIHVPALPQLRTLTSYVEGWTADLRRLDRGAPVPRRLVEQAISLTEDFLTDPTSNGVIIHGDLHYANVLSADREPWLVIDPKPMSGDPHYEVAPLLWNRFDELRGDVRDGIRRRFHTVVDVAGLDDGRARDWVVFRMMCNAMERLQDPPGSWRRLPDDDWLTLCIAVAKAVQD
ncbi:MAG: aminoglycoside phosphotransferase family protein [Marmoricola sp.]